MKSNYLDFVPVKAKDIHHTFRDNGNITLLVSHNSMVDKIAQKVFHKAPVSTVDLDENGSTVWSLIDGKRSIYEIGLIVKERLGEKAEPLFPRLVQFFKLLDGNHYIEFKKS
ncbi:PqqD family protein [Butyrivibrio sp. MC2013]|uniref:PqqD family protein n=1 Tax=Butyrivibrio sp. MC2013 TaxID=1280686 RepID=UPI00040F37A9|nr:PqqD family protein [Butyrivibrio sp. MC2013]